MNVEAAPGPEKGGAGASLLSIPPLQAAPGPFPARPQAADPRILTNTSIMNSLRISSLLGLAFLAPAATAGTLFVDANLNTGANDGSSWANAYQGSGAVQVALTASVAGDDIWVADGVYITSQTGTRTESFRMEDDVRVYGGFNGSETLLSERVLGATPSIMTADVNGDDNTGGSNAENSYHVVRAAGANAGSLLDGFEIQAGNANLGSSNNDRGAGIICGGGATMTIQNCNFKGNRCTFGGGAGYINGASPKFIDCTFESNDGNNFGGAFDMAGASNVLFDRCSFTNNTANRGGALEIFSSNGVVVSNCLFANNSATGSGGGGGMWMGSGGNTQIINSTFANNSSSSQTNGGLRNQGTSASVANSIFWGNTGPGGAMGVANQLGIITNVTYTTVMGGFAGVGNSAANPGFVNSGASDFSLSAGSPAIDAANNAAVPATASLDLAGNPRFVDDPTVVDTGVGSIGIADMGAYEKQVANFPTTAYCFGDGTGTACPCNNAGGAGAGCANSAFASGSTLTVLGTGSISSDTILLSATESAPNKPGVFFQGVTQQSSGAGVVLGDGLRCAGGQIVRLEVVFANGAGAAQSTVPVGFVGGALSGDTRRYQWWYRDANWGSCSGQTNLSNAVEFTWIP